MTRRRYPEIPLAEDRAISIVANLKAYGIEEAIRVLADYTAFTSAHALHKDAAPLTPDQAIAMGRWIHAVADAVRSELWERK